MNRNFLYVIAGLVLGVILGIASFYSFPDRATAFEVAKYMSLVSSIFLKLIKMIIGPLVLSTLVVGIGHMGDAATVSAEAFSITFDHAGSFAIKRRLLPLVLRAEAPPAPLFGLWLRLGDAMARNGLRGGPARSFTPHMTLLYDLRHIETCAVEPVSWIVRELVLVHSRHGETRHIWLGRWPLHESRAA